MENDTKNLVSTKWEIIRTQLESGHNIEDIYLEGKYKDFMTSDDFKSRCYNEYILDKQNPQRHLNHSIKTIKKHNTNFVFTDNSDNPKVKYINFILLLILVSILILFIYY